MQQLIQDVFLQWQALWWVFDWKDIPMVLQQKKDVPRIKELKNQNHSMETIDGVIIGVG